MCLATFTIEISNEIPPDAQDWSPYRPFKFLCGALVNALDEIRWSDKADQFFAWLCDAFEEYDVYSWNGVGFGFPVLSDTIGPTDSMASLARRHYDVMFEFFCHHGYAISLDSVARGMGFAEVADQIEAQKNCISDWYADGWMTDIRRYSTRKTELLLDIILAAQEGGGFVWKSKSGKPHMEIVDRFLTVDESLALPEPNVSWLIDPWSRDKFVGWLS